MADMHDIVRVAVDGYRGTVNKYSVKDSQDVLRQALVEANNGSTKVDFRAIRDGKCTGLFAIVEEILSETVNTGLAENEYFNAIADYRNVALGDANEFVVENSTLFVVSTAADGTQGIRRQRLNDTETVIIPTELKVVKMYEELNRVLAGQVDFNRLIDKVAASFQQQILNDVYTAWAGVAAADIGGTDYYPVAGTYDEDTLLTVIEHVEAAAGGRTATIIGTKAALRGIAPSIQGVESKGDLYNMGLTD